MFDKNKAVLGLLAAVVVASGCTQTGGSSVETTQTSAVQIQEFDAFPDQIFEGNEVRLHASIKNTGGAVARSPEMQLYNLPDSWGNSDATLFGSGNMNPPDPSSSVPSAPKSDDVTLTAPSDLADNVAIPYNIGGRLTFGYTTNGVSQIQVMSEERFRTSGASLTQPSIDNTGGPIQFEVRSRTPIVVFDNGGGDTGSEICVIARNVGSGTPFSGSGSPSSDNVDQIELSADAQGGAISLSDGPQNPVSIIGGKGVGCWTIDPASSGNIQTTVPITFTANYNYMKEVTTSVTVESSGN